MCLRGSADLENELVAVERIKEYCELPSEAPWCLDDVPSSSSSCDSPPPYGGAKHQPPSPDDSLDHIDSLNSNNNINSYEDIMPSDAERLITPNGADIMPYKNSASQDEVELLELSAISEGNTTPQRASWPSEGTVTWQGYSTRHRPGLKLVLCDLTCHIRAQEKVGVVGRTGTGKSSMGLGLLRAMEAAEGRVQVDGRDLTTVGLHQLRGSAAVTIIPQDPFLFSGSLRFNLDPSNNHDDCEIWNALETVHLREYIISLPGTLDFDCGENGVNFSVGQRQLVCMARALLRRPRILLLDEATAAVDADTDALIQGAIRAVAATSRCTVISIAHRLHTVMDCDRIMVINKGKIAEFDTPENLCQNVHSLFYQMAKDAGIL